MAAGMADASPPPHRPQPVAGGERHGALPARRRWRDGRNRMLHTGHRHAHRAAARTHNHGGRALFRRHEGGARADFGGVPAIRQEQIQKITGMEISVIIPVYNKVDYIDRCLESILTQDFSDFEIVAVDDGSTDGSAAKLDTLAQHDDRVRVFHQPNGGVTAARRHGVAEARGRYIMFADADDMLTPHAMAALHEAIVTSGADEVIGTFTNQYHAHCDSGRRGWHNSDELIGALLSIKNTFCVLWGILFKRQLLEGCLNAPREIIEREDSLMQIKCLMKEPKVWFIADEVYWHEEDVPNTRVEDLRMIRIYDDELRRTLQPKWQVMEPWFLLNQIKVYENFLYKRQFHVLDRYYRPLRQQVDSRVPWLHRLFLALPPRLAYYPLRWFKDRMRKRAQKQ